MALTITDDDKDVFDTLYARFKKLPTGKNALGADNAAPSKIVQREINSTLISDLKNALNRKQKGRRLTNNDISLAKKLSGPQNKLSTEMELVQLLTSLNLLSTAIRLKMEKKNMAFLVLPSGFSASGSFENLSGSEPHWERMDFQADSEPWNSMVMLLHS